MQKEGAASDWADRRRSVEDGGGAGKGPGERSRQRPHPRRGLRRPPLQRRCPQWARQVCRRRGTEVQPAVDGRRPPCGRVAGTGGGGERGRQAGGLLRGAEAEGAGLPGELRGGHAGALLRALGELVADNGRRRRAGVDRVSRHATGAGSGLAACELIGKEDAARLADAVGLAPVVGAAVPVGVGQPSRVRVQRRARRDGHHCRPAARSAGGSSQGRAQLGEEEEMAGVVDGEVRLEALRRAATRRAVNTRAEDKATQSTLGGRGANIVGPGANGGEIGKVEGIGGGDDSSARLRLQKFGACSECLLHSAAAEDHFEALSEQGSGNGATNTAARARNDDRWFCHGRHGERGAGGKKQACQSCC
jgi:hypothetical protein